MLVETTGLADPAPIVQLLLNNPLVSHFVRLDAVVTTVDAVNGATPNRRACGGGEAGGARRPPAADQDRPRRGDAIEQLDGGSSRSIPARRIVSHGEIAPDALFGAALFDPARKTPDVQRWINEPAYGRPGA